MNMLFEKVFPSVPNHAVIKNMHSLPTCFLFIIYLINNLFLLKNGVILLPYSHLVSLGLYPLKQY